MRQQGGVYRHPQTWGAQGAQFLCGPRLFPRLVPAWRAGDQLLGCPKRRGGCVCADMRVSAPLPMPYLPPSYTHSYTRSQTQGFAAPLLPIISSLQADPAVLLFCIVLALHNFLRALQVRFIHYITTYLLAHNCTISLVL